MSDQKPPRDPPAATAKPRPAAAKKAPAKKAAAKPAVTKPAVAKTPASKDGAGKPRQDNSSASKPSASTPSTSTPSASKGQEKPVVAAKSSPGNGDPKRAAQPAPPAPTPAPDETHPDLIRVPMAVRWRDLDAFNHVNNSKYLSYLEEARLHWMLGVPGQGMDDHVAPVVAAAQLNYRRPITWPTEVVIELFVERLGNTSLSIGHRIVDDEDRSIVYCDGNVVMVWIDRDSGRAAQLPRMVREACSR